MTSNITAERGNTTIPRTKFTFELVQIFRGIAALMVIGYHCDGALESYFGTVFMQGLFSLGLYGVDFFFVLSGFIITYIHIADVQQQRNLVPFIKKRFFRIYPFFWVVALATFAFLVFADKGKLEFADHTLSWSSGSDWLYVIKSFLLFPQLPISIVDVSWTLNFEILFYFVFGLAIMGGWKVARIIFWAWLALILLFAFGVITNRSYYTGFFLSPLISEFLMGCVLAWAFRYEKIKLTLPIFLIIGGLLAVGQVVYLKVFNHHLGRQGFNYVFIIGGATLLLWAAATIDKTRKFPAKKFSFFLLLGNASYAVYLTHTLLIKILFRLAQRLLPAEMIRNNHSYALILLLAVVVITVIIGIAIHLTIEQPLLNYTNRKFVPERKRSVI